MAVIRNPKAYLRAIVKNQLLAQQAQQNAYQQGGIQAVADQQLAAQIASQIASQNAFQPPSPPVIPKSSNQIGVFNQLFSDSPQTPSQQPQKPKSVSAFQELGIGVDEP